MAVTVDSFSDTASDAVAFYPLWLYDSFARRSWWDVDANIHPIQGGGIGARRTAAESGRRVVPDWPMDNASEDVIEAFGLRS